MSSPITPQPAPSGILASAMAAWVALSPPLKSVITSVLLIGATAVTTWLVKAGIVPADEQTAVIGYIVTGGGVVIMAAIVWWKSRSQTQASMVAALPQAVMMKAINDAPNGAKVVDANSPGAPISAPLK